MSESNFINVFGAGRGISPYSDRSILMKPEQFPQRREQLLDELRQEIAAGNCLRASLLLNSDYDTSDGIGSPEENNGKYIPLEAQELADLIAQSMNSRRMSQLQAFTTFIWRTLLGDSADQKELDAFFNKFLLRENETDAGLLLWSAYRSICTENTFVDLFYPVDTDLLAKDDLEGTSDARSRYLKALADHIAAQHDVVFSRLNLDLAPNHIPDEDPTIMWQYCLSALLAQWASSPQTMTLASVQKHARFWLCGHTDDLQLSSNNA